jgi:protein SCO1
MTDSPKPVTPTPPREPGNRPLTYIIIAIALALGAVVFFNYQVTTRNQLKEDRLPYMRRIDKPVEFVERSGAKVDVMALRGKVLLLGYVYTRCPRGCAGVVQEMMSVLNEFNEEKDSIHMVSVSVDPDHDGPDQLKEFAEKFQITEQTPWWLLTSDKRDTQRFMTLMAGFHPTREQAPEERMSPEDLFIHDMRLALIDQAGHVRGYYEVMSMDPAFMKRSREALRRDLRILLKETPLAPNQNQP